MQKVLPILILLILALVAAGILLKASETEEVTTNPTESTMDQTDNSLTFNDKTFKVGFTMPGGGTDFSSESYEWITDSETVENWTQLITTHKLKSANPEAPLSAEAYAQNVAAMLESNGALILETSLINQDMESLGVDPNYPPFLLAYLFAGEGTTEFNMQKIVQLESGEVASIIYAERFPTKTEPEMKAYYDSEERTNKRAELIRLKLPY